MLQNSLVSLSLYPFWYIIDVKLSEQILPFFEATQIIPVIFVS